MPTLKHDAFFRRNPAFTGEELPEPLSSTGRTGARTQESLVAYHTRTGRLIRARRGQFAIIPPGADRDTYPIDPYLVASRLTPNSVLSHHTALELHGRAYSVWQHLTYLASRPLVPLMFCSHVYRGARFAAALVDAGRNTAALCVVEYEVCMRWTPAPTTLYALNANVRMTF